MRFFNAARERLCYSAPSWPHSKATATGRPNAPSAAFKSSQQHSFFASRKASHDRLTLQLQLASRCRCCLPCCVPLASLLLLRTTRHSERKTHHHHHIHHQRQRVRARAPAQPRCLRTASSALRTSATRCWPASRATPRSPPTSQRQSQRVPLRAPPPRACASRCTPWPPLPPQASARPHAPRRPL